MGVLDRLRGKGKKEEAEQRKQLGQDLTRAETMRVSQGPMPQELINQLGKEYYLLVDDLTLSLIHGTTVKNDDGEEVQVGGEFRDIIPAVSHLNRTTKITRRDAEIQMLQMECLFDLHTMEMEEDKFDHKGWAKLDALRIYAQDTIFDKIEGHRARLLSDQIKIIEARVLEAKKRSILP